MIPKVIHQTWKNSDLSEQQRKWSETWREKNPDYKYRFYTDKDCERFVWLYYRQYYSTYSELEPVQKADLFRYLVLHRHGGVYADIDAECLKPLDSLLDNCDKLVTGIEYYDKLQYLQWFIACPKGCSLILEVAENVKKRNSIRLLHWAVTFFTSNNKPNYMTYWISGPENYTDVLVNKGPDKLKVFPKGVLGCYDRKLIGDHTYVDHHFSGTWKRREENI